MTRKINVRLTVPHSKKCLVGKYGNDPEAFYVLSERSPINGTVNGKPHKKGQHWWLEYICNDPICSAKAIVNPDYLARVIHNEIK